MPSRPGPLRSTERTSDEQFHRRRSDRAKTSRSLFCATSGSAWCFDASPMARPALCGPTLPRRALNRSGSAFCSECGFKSVRQWPRPLPQRGPLATTLPLHRPVCESLQRRDLTRLSGADRLAIAAVALRPRGSCLLPCDGPDAQGWPGGYGSLLVRLPRSGLLQTAYSSAPLSGRSGSADPVSVAWGGGSSRTGSAPSIGLGIAIAFAGAAFFVLVESARVGTTSSALAGLSPPGLWFPVMIIGAIGSVTRMAGC